MQLPIKSVVEGLARGTVNLAGKTREVRVLSASDTGRLYEIFPPPEPTRFIKDPNAGSRAAPIPDGRDPEYARQRAAWFVFNRCLQLILAMDMVTDDGAGWDRTKPDAELRAWCERAVAELRDLTTERDLGRAWDQLQDLVDGSGDRARGQLITELRDDASDDPALYALPERYGFTETGSFVHLCRVFHIDPFAALGLSYDHPGMWALLRAHVSIEHAEQSRALGRLESAREGGAA